MNQKTRYYYLDVMKCIAIIFVCATHFSWVGDCDYTSQGITNRAIFHRYIIGIQSICVPLFLMVNGALLLNKAEFDLKKHVKRIILILIQFWIWRAITFGIIGMHYNLIWNEIGRTEIINAVLFFGKIDGIDTNHFWFIPMLISIYVLYPIIYQTFWGKDKHILYGFLLILFILCFLIPDIGIFTSKISLIKNINIAGLSKLNPFQNLISHMLFYFILGGTLQKHIERLNISFTKLVTVFFSGVFLLFGEWYIISEKNDTTWDSIYGGYSTVATVLMAFAVFIMVYRFSNKILQKFGEIRTITIISNSNFPHQ